MDLNDMNDFDFSYNKVFAGDLGVDVDDANDVVTPTAKSTVVNNMIIGIDEDGMTWDDAEFINLYHNTVKGNPAIHFNDNGGQMHLVNNILVADADYALEIDDGNPPQWDSINNNIYLNDGTTDLFQFGSDYADLADWRANVGPLQQAFSLEGDPRFISATDLHVRGFFSG